MSEHVIESGNIPSVGQPTEKRTRVTITAFLATAGGLLSCLIGNVWWDDRLIVSGIPLNIFIFAVLALGIFALRLNHHIVRSAFLLQIPVFLLALMLPWSADLNYGAYKLLNLLAASVLSTLYFLFVIQESGLAGFLRQLILGLFGLLIVALIYKWNYGLFDREVLFFMNGPIVFARLMGIASIAALLALRSRWRFILAIVFVLAAAWTESKGPLLALVLSLGLAIAFSPNSSERWALAGTLTFVGATLFFAVRHWISGRLLALVELWTVFRGDAASASIDTRLRSIERTLKLIADHPFGIGWGSWAHGVPNNFGFYYPHNILLELVSEAGLFLGLIALLPFMWFMFSRVRALKYIALFLFLSQMVSGDLLDARYLLIFSVLSVVAPKLQHQRS